MKSKRHLKIMNIIKDEAISTQEDLVKRLLESGIEVTQATISRDIKKLGLIKVPDGHGGYKYSLPVERTQSDIENWMKKMFQDFVIDLDYSENIIILKALPGTAQGLASAIDKAEWEQIMGSVAGDDTILVVIKSREKTREVYNRFKSILI
jgi:transcriptional regulator of arginine metabolism